MGALSWSFVACVVTLTTDDEPAVGRQQRAQLGKTVVMSDTNEGLRSG